jgi:hypothetical protein
MLNGFVARASGGKMGFEVRLMPEYDQETRLLTDGMRQLARAEDPKAVRGAFSGNVLMIASGPSAAGFPLECYRDIPWAMMNGSVTLLEGSAGQPFLYICIFRPIVTAHSV